jgi:hypothetical protein
MNKEHIMVLKKAGHDDVSIAGMTGMKVEDVQRIIYENDAGARQALLNNVRWARATQDDAVTAHATVMMLMADPNTDDRVKLQAAIHVKDEFHGRLNREKENAGINSHDAFLEFLREKNKTLEIRVVEQAVTV